MVEQGSSTATTSSCSGRPRPRQDIVVALAGQDEIADEATVKRFFIEKGRVRLQPENSAMEPLYPEHVGVLGKVVGVFGGWVEDLMTEVILSNPHA